MSELEDFYIKLLDLPKKGDLDSLERKFRHHSAELSQRDPDARVNLSLIQKSGEIKHAYLFLKAQWSLEEKQRCGVNLDVRRKSPKVLEKKKDTLLDKVYKRLKSLVKVSVVTMVCLVTLQFSPLIIGRGEIVDFDKLLSSNFFSEQASTGQARLEELAFQRRLDNFRVITRQVKAEVPVEKLNPYLKKRSPLMLAAQHCDVSSIRKEISSGSNVNEMNSNGETALHWLARRNCKNGVELALRYGANLGIRDHSGRTAMDWARIASSIESIRLMSKHLNNKS